MRPLPYLYYSIPLLTSCNTIPSLHNLSNLATPSVLPLFCSNCHLCRRRVPYGTSMKYLQWEQFHFYFVETHRQNSNAAFSWFKIFQQSQMGAQLTSYTWLCPSLGITIGNLPFYPFHPRIQPEDEHLQELIWIGTIITVILSQSSHFSIKDNEWKGQKQWTRNWAKRVAVNILLLLTSQSIY